MVVNHQINTFFLILLNYTRQILFDVICQVEVKFSAIGMGSFTHWPPGKERWLAIDFLQTWE
jgi:hypothetical protein